MAKYEFYRELREYMGHVLRKAKGLSKKAAKKIDPVGEAMKLFFEDPRSGLTLDAAVLADEEDFIRLGRRVYLPQNKELVEMLWRSNMDVTLSDIEHFPRCFSVAWPKGTVIDGVELSGCLVWFGKHKERDEIAELMEEWTGQKTKMIRTGDYIGDDDEYSFHLVFAEGNNFERYYMRVSMPEAWLAECLKSADDLENKLGDYDSPMVLSLTKEETHKQYVLVRSVINMMVYATACPDAVQMDWPEGVGSSPQTRGRKPLTLASPIPKEYQRKGGTHASPEPHFRNPHFRRYPMRNGSRKPGIVFVSGCLVNAELEPTTIKGKRR